MLHALLVISQDRLYAHYDPQHHSDCLSKELNKISEIYQKYKGHAHTYTKKTVKL